MRKAKEGMGQTRKRQQERKMAGVRGRGNPQKSWSEWEKARMCEREEGSTFPIQCRKVTFSWRKYCFLLDYCWDLNVFIIMTKPNLQQTKYIGQITLTYAHTCRKLYLFDASSIWEKFDDFLFYFLCLSLFHSRWAVKSPFVRFFFNFDQFKFSFSLVHSIQYSWKCWKWLPPILAPLGVHIFLISLSSPHPHTHTHMHDERVLSAWDNINIE